MPCTSNYSGESFSSYTNKEPTTLQKYLSECLCFLGELAGHAWEKEWLTQHPRVKKEFTTKQDLDKLTEELCKKLQKVDVSNYSLELQIWWRDHVAHDTAQLKKEFKRIKTIQELQNFINSLSPYEVKCLFTLK